ncbi:hypothetical protein EJB05_53491 [Eragrostis curvula]|uniref:Uncharacterized protein n=1 Tax=Eragrostis curvula TaxID=38414 RepID=A0A5J9SPY1_9POAL|nr:hypothetical protein EJB05_53491 [Eragrostis curvula]
MMEAKMEEKLREERERYEALMRSQMETMFAYFQRTGAPLPPPDLFPVLAGVLPPVGGPPPVGASPSGTPNQSEASNFPISPTSPWARL